MYGLLNAALKEHIVETWGEPVWRQIGSPVDVFEPMHAHPDSVTYNIVNQVSALTGVDSLTLLHDVGEKWVGYTARHGYGPLFLIAGPDLYEFLKSLNYLHARVKITFDELKPPVFHTEELGDRQLRVHYMSNRPGLCPLVTGVLEGLSARFGQPITIRQDRCSFKNDPHCEFLVQL